MKIIVHLPVQLNLEDINDVFVNQLLTNYKTNTDYSELIDYTKNVIKNYVIQNLNQLEILEPIIAVSDIPELEEYII